MKAIIKTKEEINNDYSHLWNGSGWHLIGQYFPEELLRYSGQEIEVEPMSERKLAWESKINNEWHFFSKDALRLFK
jgi:hypothetical protein